MNRKHLTFIMGLLVLILLLGLMTGAMAAESEKTKEQYAKEGNTIVTLPDTKNGISGSLALDKGVTYLKETSKGGITRDGNRFTLSSGKYKKTPAPNGLNSRYCILSDGMLYFGALNSASDGKTVILDDMITLDPEKIFSPVASNKGSGVKLDEAKLKKAFEKAEKEGRDVDLEKEEIFREVAGNYAPFTAFTDGAWVDIDQDFELDTKDIPMYHDVPMYIKGNIKFKIIHSSYDPGPTYDTRHTLHCYFDVTIDDIGFKADEPTTVEKEIPLVEIYEAIDLITIKIAMEDFVGKVDWNLHAHLGFKFHFLTWGLPCDYGDWYCEVDDDNTIDAGVANVNCSGEIKAGFTVGPSVSTDQYFFAVSVGMNYYFGLKMESLPDTDRFVPADTKDSWHICDQCVQEDMMLFTGPASIYLYVPSWDVYLSYDITDEIDDDPFYTFHFSNTFDECEEGPCKHWAWKTKTHVTNADGTLNVQNATVSYSPAAAHCDPYASGTTDASGNVDLYMPAGSTYEITAKVVSQLDPSWEVSGKTSIDKKEAAENATIKLDFPTAHVYFKNPASGEATSWPDDMTFSPFFTQDVTLPDNVPGLSGRQFTGWNTAEDGSGTAYAPGAKLKLAEDLTLFAQWDLAGDSWYVVYDANGGTKAPLAQVVPRGENAVLSAELPESGTLIFKGWTPDLKTLDPVYQPGDTLLYDSGKNYVVLYALWDLSPVPQPIHIAFEANGVTEAVLPADVWMEQGTWMQLEGAIAPLGSSYSFLGWSEDPYSSEPEYQVETSYYFFRDTTLYAIWKNQDAITLAFRDPLPDVTHDMPSPIYVLSSMSRNVRIPSQTPRKSGRVFTGWNTERDGSGKAFAPGTVFTIEKDTILWAQWEIAGDSWFIVYDANGGTKAPGTQIVRQGKDAVLTKELPEGGKMIFKGWTTDPQTLKTVYQPGDTLPYDSGKSYVVLYAVWNLSPVPQPIHIAFEANGGDEAGIPADVWMEQGGWLQLAEAYAPFGSQYTFVGWSEDPSSKNPEFRAGNSYYFYKDTTLYAIWDKLETLTLQFRDSLPDEASDMPSPITIWPSMSQDVQIPSTIPEKSGRVFTGWNTAEDGSGTDYAPGAVFTLTKSTILWAQWEKAEKSWYIIYDANGGTKAPGAQIMRQGKDAVLTKEKPESVSMVFQGWTTDLKTLDPIYQPGDTLPYEKEKNVVVLYALWNLSPIERPIHITFEDNGGAGASLPADVWMERGTWLQLEGAVAPLGSGYTFLGWSEEETVKKPEYLAGNSYYFDKDTVLYAVWSLPDTTTLIFRDPLPDGASGLPEAIMIRSTMSPNVQIPDQIPEKSGRVFISWNTAEDGSGLNYAPGSVFTLVKNSVLWAQWKTAGDSWVIVYNANGGTKAPSAQIVRKKNDAVLTRELPENEEMYFTGWALDPDAAKPAYQPGDTLPYSGENLVVLYALWSLDPVERPVVVSFDANGGLQETAPQEISSPKGKKVRLPEHEPSWDAQHDFLGWASTAQAKDPEWNPGEKVAFDQDTTLYAVWDAHYKVISGAGSIWTKGSGKPQHFLADGDVKYFQELQIDGKPIKEGVEISSGSTLATISAKTMEKLSTGDHKVTFVYVDGKCSAKFTVNPKTPKTGDAGHPALWLLLIVSGLGGLALLSRHSRLARRKK